VSITAKLLRTTTTGLLLSFAVVGSAFAYSATSVDGARYNNGGVYGSVVATAQAACSAGPVPTSTACGALPASGGTCRSAAACGGFTYYNWEKVASYTCPGGGTLSGTTCNCAVGETDTGSACEVPACPAGEFRRSSGAACEAQCPEGQGNGPASYPPSGSAGFCMERQDFVFGSGWTSVSSTTAVPKCKYAGTGISMCADYGAEGVACYSENTYGTGTVCGTETTVPDDVTVCDTGEMWCEKTGASCASGYVAGTFSGKDLCVKTGETVTVTPRTVSALDPPNSVPPPPTVTGGGGGTVTTTPTSDVVVAVGPRASTVGGAIGGSGTGGGSGGEGVDSCGLPGTPPCKIDETGTPTGSGAFGDALSSLEAAKGEAITGLGTVSSATGKNTAWTFSLSLPSTCSPMNVNMIYETVELDPCAWIAVMHDLMSMIWAASTLFLTVGMVGRTLREA